MLISLRKAISSLLESAHPRVYFQAADESTPFPYLVYDLPNSFDDGESQEVFVVDIDGWDAPATGDTTVLEAIMSSVNTGLNKRTINVGGMYVTFYLDRRLSLTDDDKRIRRRKHIYQARLFERR